MNEFSATDEVCDKTLLSIQQGHHLKNVLQIEGRKGGKGEEGKKSCLFYPEKKILFSFVFSFLETGSHSVIQAGVQWCNHNSLQP